MLSKHPLNIKEHIDFMESSLKMRLLFKSKFIKDILGQTEIFPNDSLPSKYKIDRSYHLGFCKE